MQNPTTSFKDVAAKQISEGVKRFFNLPSSNQPALLTKQPLSQRQLFLKKTIRNHYLVFAQLRSPFDDQTPINIQGTVHRLDEQHYVLTHGHVNYPFTIDQLQYLARI